MKHSVYVLLFAGLWTACGGPDTQETKGGMTIKEPVVSKNSEALNRSFEKLLTAYYSLKDALVEYDTAKANNAAAAVATGADSLSLTEIKNDSLGAIRETATNYVSAISSAAKAFQTKAALQDKKKDFQQISDAMYDLVRTIRYDMAIIYHQRCPMAFNDEEEAYWISNSNTVVNPYLGKKHPKYKDGMLECGEVTDSLDFSKD